MLLYLTFWFPSQERARAVAKFMTATSLAGVVGGPVSSALLRLNGVTDLRLAVVVSGRRRSDGVAGISVLWLLSDGPATTAWMTADEKNWLAEELRQDRLRYGATEHHSLKDAFRLPAVWLLAGVYIVIQIGVYVVNLWMPLMLDSLRAGRGGCQSDRALFHVAVPAGCGVYRARGLEL